MNARPFTTLAALALLALTALGGAAQAEGKFKQESAKKSVKQTLKQDAEMEPETASGELPMPSRETLARSSLPGPAKCSMLCGRAMQDCTQKCKGNTSCSGGCYKDYGTCAQRCGGPIGSDPGAGKGGGGGGREGGGGCESACVSDMNSCRTDCAGKQPCLGRCMDQMSQCTSACN
jgi:hypothetical protein